jgi:hypothetical protein
MKLFVIISIFVQLITSAIDITRIPKTDNPMTENQEPLFTFGIISDVQYCDCDNSNTRVYRNSLLKLTDALPVIAEYSPDFILNLGDLIDRDFNSVKPVLDIIDDSGIDTYHCLGNHDYSVAGGDIKKVSKITGNKNGYYSFTHKSFRFIILNGTDMATYAPTPAQRKEGSQYLAILSANGAANASDWNGGIGPTQLKWLQNQLDESITMNEKVFLICHFPLLPLGSHNLFNSEEVLNVLKLYPNIISWLNGHNHNGGYDNSNMIHFVTFRGMVETEATNSFAVVEVYPSKLWIKGFGREKNQILAY